MCSTSVGAKEEKESRGHKIGDLAKAGQHRREEERDQGSKTQNTQRPHAEGTVLSLELGSGGPVWKKSLAESHKRCY